MMICPSNMHRIEDGDPNPDISQTILVKTYGVGYSILIWSGKGKEWVNQDRSEFRLAIHTYAYLT